MKGLDNLENYNSITGVLRRYNRLICLFAFYAFVFLLTELTVNMRALELWGGKAVLGVYAFGLFCTGAGYIAYAVAQGSSLSSNIRKLFLFFVSIIAMAGICVLIYTSGALAIPAGWLALFAMGYLAAAIYFYMACALINCPFTGHLVGISMFFAVLLQYGLMHAPWEGNGLVLTVLLMSVLGICLLIKHPLGEWCFDNTLAYKQSLPAFPKETYVAVFMVVCMSFGFTFSDECVTALDAKGELDVSAWPRLFYGVGLLISGWLVDIGKRRHIYVVTGIAFSLALLSPTFLMLNFYNISMTIMYLYSGFYVMFLTIVFLDLAPRTDKPWLWAGMGRIARCFTSAIVIFPAELVMDKFGIWGIISVNAFTALLVLFLCAYAKEEQRKAEMLRLDKVNENLLSEIEATAQAKLETAVSVAVSAVREEAVLAEQQAQIKYEKALSAVKEALEELEKTKSALESSNAQVSALRQDKVERQSIDAFAKIHELTPREKEVLELILSKDDTTKELAKKLMISERVCQRYLTSIYDKTGTNSKVGLILLYYGADKKQ